MNCLCTILLAVLVGMCCSCHRQTDPSQKPGGDSRTAIVARVGKEFITTAEFQSELNRRWRGVPGAEVTLEQRERLLEEMIRAKATLARARSAGFDRDPETVELIERLIISRYIETEFAGRSGADPVVGEEEILSFYEGNRTRFNIPPAIRAGFIWLKLGSKADPDRRAAMLEHAKNLRVQAASSDAATFKSLVQQHSDDQATRYTGGDTGWLTEGEPVSCEAAVAAAAFQLQESGEIAPVVATSNGFYIVRLLERRSAGVRPLAEVREAIRYELQQQKRQQREREFFAEMKRGLKIEVNHELLESIQTTTVATNTAPPAMPGS